MATSSCEAEYRAAFTATVECVWLRRLMADLGVGQSSATTIFTDSQSTLAIARNPIFHAHTKHIELHYHYVRERLSAGEINWLMCQHKTPLQIFSQRLCLVRNSKLFANLWAYSPLRIDCTPWGWALPYTLSARSCLPNHSRRGFVAMLW